MTEQRKATRRLKNFDFSEEGSHLALVHKDQGGAANGYSTLVMKATGKYTPEFLQKAAQVQVTLSFEEFLRKFFDMWYSDAKVLATLLGMQDEEDSEDSYYQSYVEEQVEKFEILKSAHAAPNKIEYLSGLPEDDYLSILKAQERFEKALTPKAQDGGKKPVTKTEEGSEPASQAIVSKATTAIHTEDTPMPDSAQPELIAKAQYDEIQKAFDTQKVELQKANDALAVFKKAEQERVAKARQDTVLAAVEVQEEAEKLFKAVGELSDDNFQAVIEVVKALAAKADDSALFTETGSPAEGEKVQKSALRAQLENKYNK